ncbi:DUF6578 domain-containing protein [Streptomyces sp. NBC_00557]|uniref:DUF6578 domain-containing protein n=1 Tax=Streptomyces sp. NBC_00557 TaxID=2975776 RepID=UPI002E82490E|nr:DUF6578 domain-containing protein [Streptomyces sp. NBC_00557]WUC37459.1 hypothetical protein OG956_26195 [Streptomyces sp. NBC_00557]
MRVFYEDWQMECCGTPFAVGDEVAWRLVAHDAEDIRQGWGYGAGARVEHHGAGPDDDDTDRARTTGRVHAIELVRQEHLAYTDRRALERLDRAQAGDGGKPVILPSPYQMEAVPGAHTLQAVDRCPKWFEREEPGRSPGPHRVRHAVGVLVTLDVPGGTPSQPCDPR